MIFLRLLWIVWISAAAYGQVDSREVPHPFPKAGTVYYYEDSAGALNWEKAKELPFKRYTKERVNFGFTTSVYWLKIDLASQNDSVSTREWLMLSYPLLDSIDVYLLTSEGKLIEHTALGASVTDREYPMRNFLTQLPLENHPDANLLIRVKTQSSMQIPLMLQSTREVLSTVETGNLLIGVYYGIFLIIFLYNAVILVYTKDLNYLRYILFLSTFITWQLSFDGIGREYIWPELAWLIHDISASLIPFTAFFSLYFGRNFLSTERYVPIVDRFIVALMWISFLLGILSLILPYATVIVYNTALVSLVPIVLLATGIAVMRRGYRPARFYVVGWSSFLVGTIIFAFNKFDIIPGFYGVNHVQQIGSAIEMIFLSWALADRVHLLQREYIDKLNHLNETLSENVHDALAEARAKDRLFVQQSRLAAMGEMIEQIAHQWRQPLNNLALINQDQYVKYTLGKCDDTSFYTAHERIDEHLQYLSKTIDDFRNFYKNDKSTQPEEIGDLVSDALRLSDVFLKYAKIKTIVELHTTRKVNLAKNEMIQVLMNLLKNAHDAIVEKKVQEGWIKISARDAGAFVEVSIEDNAGGIPPKVIDKIFDIYFTTKDSEQGTGLGLHMSKYIIEESFGGTIRVENTQKGARFVIVLPSDDSETLS